MMTIEDLAVCLPWNERSKSASPQSQPSLCIVKLVPEKKHSRTPAEWDYLDKMGRWHHRRQRRRSRLENHYR